MKLSIVIVWLLLSKIDGYKFPEGFQFGVATASFQVEGAWNVSGKGESIWDHITHNNLNFIADQSNADVACATYYKTKEDVQLLKDINVDYYRFSISWPRIFPSGHTNSVNEDGIRYYRELIDELLKNDITPLVTMFHWDLPQALHEIGGWPNPLLADLFVNYADKLFYYFGDKVKNWITFNEPYQICDFSYSDGILAPAYKQKGIGGYLCTYTLLIAHGKTYKLYQDKYKIKQNGKIGITIQGPWFEPETDAEEDRKAAENMLQFTFGIYAHPIYKGDYPPIVRERVNVSSTEENRRRSRLIPFTPEEINLIKDSADFLGVNHYTTFICVPRNEDIQEVIPMNTDGGASCYQDEEWASAASRWFRIVPWGFRKVLNWVKEEYNNPEVIITENGFSDHTGELRDCGRISYYNSYLTQVLNAIYEDGCNIVAYTAWSFLDNFEWINGYREKFGLYYVDFEDDDRPRTPKMSAYAYKNIIDTREINVDYTPEGFARCGAVSIVLSVFNISFCMFLYIVIKFN